MMRSTKHAFVLAAGLVPAFAACGQSSIDSAHKYCWNENVGWMNWRDANSGNAAVRDSGTFFSGYVWCENIGWINMGDGTPVNGIAYANVNGTDFGVNIGGTGSLTGMAWSENAGWINFAGGSLASPAQPARLDTTANRLRGYAWGENIGWVNLDDAANYVKLVCYANCDQSSTAPILNANDFQCFLNAYAMGSPSANCDRSSSPPVLNANDFQCFLNKFAAGCP